METFWEYPLTGCISGTLDQRTGDGTGIISKPKDMKDQDEAENTGTGCMGQDQIL